MSDDHSSHRPALRTHVVEGPAGSHRLLFREDLDGDLIRDFLADPDRFLGEKRKLKAFKRRMVHSFWAELGGERRRLYFKFIRTRSLKERLEEWWRGDRAVRSLEAGLEAERRGIAVPIHLGASQPLNGDRRHRDSALLMGAVPHKRDAQTVLKEKFRRRGRKRHRRFLRALGAFIADAHERGLVHTDLKLRNIFVLDPKEIRFSLIDLDRARFLSPPPKGRVPLLQIVDLVRLFKSLRRPMKLTESRRVLGSYLKARRLDRPTRARTLRLLRAFIRI